MAESIKLKPMEEAPKDGTMILIFWHDKNMDIRNYNVREACWWKPEDIRQWESGARPHWSYIDDTDSSRSITDPAGWIKKPIIKE